MTEEAWGTAISVDAADAEMHRQLLQFIGAFESLQDLVNEAALRYLRRYSPAVTAVLLQRVDRLSVERRLALLKAMWRDSGYGVDGDLVNRIYLRLAHIRNRIGHALGSQTYVDADSGTLTIGLVSNRARGPLKGRGQLNLEQLRRLRNEVDWLEKHVYRFMHDQKLARMMTGAQNGQGLVQFDPEVPPLAPVDGEPFAKDE